MKCPECGYENKADRKFCSQCGSKLGWRCPECGRMNDPEDRFCGECGARLEGSDTAIESPAIPRLQDMQDSLYIPEPLRQKRDAAQLEMQGENRLVTALFADISGFTPLSNRQTTEHVVGLVNDCFKEIVDTVFRYEGDPNRFIGDNVLAFFGAPIAHENDAERAIMAALEIRDKVRELSLDVSIGINTGMMYFGTIGTREHHEVSAYGPDINLAKRLQEAAEPGQILVGAGTYRLTRRAFDFDAIRSLSVKGFDESVTAYPVLQMKSHPEKLRGIEGLRARMIGREHEFGELKEAADTWLGGQGQMVSIIGEAGIGKSRLVSELKEYLSSIENPASGILEGRCVSIGQPISYWPFLDILRTYLGLGEEDDERTRAGKVTESITQLMPQGADEALPLLGNLLSIRYGNELDDRLKFASPEQIRHQTLMRLRDIFEILARQQPLMLILEDLHWSDDLSLDLISLLMDELANTPLMLLCVYRPEKEHRVWQLGDQARRKCLDRYTELTLHPLSSHQSRLLVESLLEIENLPEGTKDSILTKSEGNPFFIEEVIRSLIEQDMVYHEDDHWVARDEIAGIHVPDTIQSVVLARVDRLQSEARYVLQCASVIGRLFRHRLLQHISQQERDLDRHIAEFESKELIYEERTVPELEYAFKHAFTQEATYEGILDQKRREFHHLVAEGIEQLYGERLEEYYEELAHHYSRSGDIPKAVEYLFKAGDKAVKSYANEAAISYFNKAIELLKALPETPEVIQQELGLQISLVTPLIAHKGFGVPEVESAATRAREICQQLGRSNGTKVDLEDALQFSLALSGLISFYNARAELQTARDLGRQMMSLAQGAQDPTLLIFAHGVLGSTLYFLGELVEAREHLARSVELYDPQQHHSTAFLLGTDPAVAYLSYHASVIWMLGYPDQSQESGKRSLDLARRLSHPNSLGLALSYASTGQLLYEEWELAEELADAAIDLSTEHNLPFWLAMGSILRGAALVEQGQIEAGIAQISQALDAWKATGAWLGVPYYLSKLAIAYGKAGQTEDAIATLSEALDIAHRGGDCFWEAELHRLRGELLLMQGESGNKAVECFRQAIQVAQQQQAKMLELRASMSLCRLLQQQGRQREARKMLAEIYDWFTEGFDAPDLVEANRLLEELSSC